MTGRLPVLEELGRELERVAGDARPRRRFPPARLSGRVGALVAAGALATAAVATAAVLLIHEGSPLPGAHPQDLRANGIPLRGSARLAGLDAPDPGAGAAPWDLRLSRTADGEICTAVGQVVDGTFGIVGLDDVFRRLPLGGVDACSFPTPGSPVLAGARGFLGRTAAEARTVVSGVAGSDARSVTAYGAGGRRALRLGPEGAFITVFPGSPERVRPRVVVTFADGHRHTVAFEQSSAVEVADPAGGSPWTVSSEPDLQRGAYPDEDCAQATEEASQEQPSLGMPLTPSVCGRLGSQPLLVVMRRFTPGSGQGSPYPWGNAPARTLVYGVADPRVRSLSLRGAGPARTISIDRRGGAFLAVLDGRVDPRSLTLTASLSPGDTRAYVRSTPLLSPETNRPLAEPPVPPFREPAPPAPQTLPPFELPIESTARETLRAADPLDGRTWILRSWQGKPNAHVNGIRPHERNFFCVALGLLDHGRLVAPSASPSVSSPSVTAEDGRCNQSAQLSRMRYMLAMESYVTDAYAYAPRPGRVVISGMLPAGARDATLFGLGGPRRLLLDSNDAFLLVLPGSYWQSSPHIVYMLHGKRVGRGPGRKFPLGNAPSVPQSRAPDPDGAAPWGFAASRSCNTSIGRVVQGRLASLDEQTGVLKTGPFSTGGSATCLMHQTSLLPEALRHEPVEFDVQPAETYSWDPGPKAATPSRPEIERRTVPGRTLITGVARADVETITISTPTDVRTLRPSGPLHTILAVYEGVFLRGRITATIALRGDRTATERLLTPGEPPDGPTGPTAIGRLAAARRQIAYVWATIAHYRATNQLRRANAATRSLPMLRVYVDIAERRIAYERAHPGRLPEG